LFHTSFVLAVIPPTFQVSRLRFCIRLVPPVALNDPHILVTLFWSTQWYILRGMRVMKLLTVYFCILLRRVPWYAACLYIITVCYLLRARDKWHSRLERQDCSAVTQSYRRWTHYCLNFLIKLNRKK
jgi:hypothetical protein